MTAILEQLQGLVAAAEIPAGTLGVALILGLFGLMVVGLVLGQELAFVLGGAGVIVGWLAWGTPASPRHDKDLRPDAKLLHGGHPHVRADGQLPDPLQGGGRPV